MKRPSVPTDARLPATLVVLALLISGCSSIRARTELNPDHWQVYPGIQRDVSDLGDAFSGKLKGPAWTPAVVVPMLVGDLPFSTAFDTLALPYDIYRIEQGDAAH